ncbi:MAG: hypothetical protein E7668_05010 [Ruminococcaceae bacterium]|nr:hypothetical protein [Oscillospiraceae bacterium]
MLEKILPPILSILFGWLASFLTIAKSKSKERKDRDRAVEDGLEALLRAEIIRQYEKYSERGFCPIYAKEALKREYGSYHALGGNDVATELYHKILELPTDPPRDHDPTEYKKHHNE